MDKENWWFVIQHVFTEQINISYFYVCLIQSIDRQSVPLLNQLIIRFSIYQLELEDAKKIKAGYENQLRFHTLLCVKVRFLTVFLIHKNKDSVDHFYVIP